MKTYIGTKILKAEPMTEQAFESSVKKKTSPENQVDREGYKVVYDNDYTSWSPKEVFETHYREITENEKELIEK